MLLTRICIGDTNTLHNLDRKNMREYLTLAEYESFFIFDKVTYRKIGGAAISSQLGPIFSNAYLFHFEKQWFSQCNPSVLHKVYKRCVDDIFVMYFFQLHLSDFVS